MAREDRRWNIEDEEPREFRRRPDYGQTAPSEYDDRNPEARYADYRRPYRTDAEEPRRAARAERYGRDDDEARWREERAYRPFGTTGPTAYGGRADPYAWSLGDYAPYGGDGAYADYGARYARGPRRRDRPSDAYTPNPREGRGEESRSFMDRARDEVASWFGDDDAVRRRQWDEMRAGHQGRGPKGYRRSDARIQEDINDRLTDDPYIDATYIEVSVLEGDVTLAGEIYSREEKRRAERLAEDVSGVGEVQNNLRLRREGDAGDRSSTDPRSTGV